CPHPAQVLISTKNLQSAGETWSEKQMKKLKNLKSSKMGFFLLALILFWMKTYIIYISEFDLGVSNLMQHFLLFINPLSSGLILLGLALFFKGKRFGITLLIIDSLLTL